jgi:hypothetical protein
MMCNWNIAEKRVCKKGREPDYSDNRAILRPIAKTWVPSTGV